MIIDLGNPESLYAGAKAAVIEKWPSVTEHENPDNGNRWLFGIFGDVDLELRAFFSGTRPVVRATCSIGRFVPETDELLVHVNQRNRDGIGLTLGLADETEKPGTVGVFASAAVVYDFITPTSVRQAVENCVWPANIILRQGFLTRFGGELGLEVWFRRWAETAARLDPDTGETAARTLRELQARAQAGDVGRVPDEIDELLG